MKMAVLSGIAAALVVAGSASGASSAATGGRTITLRSYDQYLRITVLGWERTRRGSDAYDRPSPGHVYIAVKLRVRNLARRTYNDSLSNGAILESTTHHQFDPTFGGPNPSIDDVRIVSQDWVVGWITFEVPRTVKPRLFELTLDSGFADNATGVWHFR
jgi:uncharacterized protein DUF4352